MLGRAKMQTALASEWGRLFRNWEKVTAIADGYPDVGAHGALLTRTGARALARSMGILASCLKEAPELSDRRRVVGRAPN